MPASLANIAYRVGRLEQDIQTARAAADRANDTVVRHDERIIRLADAVEDLRDEVRAMKRAFYTAAVTVTVSAIGLVMTLYLLFE